MRQEVEKFAHIVFASSSAQRDFWLGRKSLSPDQIRERYDGLKPCLHGSDGHSIEAAGAPDGERYCWIKGAVIFDALRQACIDPASRAFIGEFPPVSALPNQVISAISIGNADWAKTPLLKLNPGLVTVIGARGSGKTALADMIAAGCDSLPADENKQSFLFRARDHLTDALLAVFCQTPSSE